MLPPGTRLGSYEILSLLGAGGMGHVYRARDTRLDRPVAIKVLKPQLAGDPQFRDRFEREARTISRLDHPHICALYDVGQSGDLSYLVMPQLEGDTLEVRLRSGLVPVDTALTIARQVADALVAAHRAGIVHRDIKPGNIFLTRADHRGLQAKLLDFGIAKPVAVLASNLTVMETEAGMTVGTASYMAPEQSRGEDVDERADVFSFGVVLYEMLTGRRPTLDAAPPDVPSTLQRVVMRCLQPLARDRFQTMGDVLEALSAERPTGDGPSIAVLPFASMSADPDNEYFGDGLAEEVLNALTRVSGLKVIARTSAFAFKGKNVDIRTIAEALGVTTVLEGSVRRAGNRVRVTAQLITAADGSHLWSERYDRQMTDIFDVQDDIARAISQALALALTPRHVSPPRSQRSLDAYEEVLRGRQNMYRVTPDALAAAHASFERARELDPASPLPHIALAWHGHLLASLTDIDPHVVMPGVLASAERALALDPAAADAFVVRASARGHYLYAWEQAAADADMAVSLNPAFADAHRVRALIYLALGDNARGLDASRTAVSLDPMNPPVRTAELMLLSICGHRQEALARANTLATDFEIWPAKYFAAAAFGHFGETDRAVEVLREGLRWAPSEPSLLGALAVMEGRRGNSSAARDALSQLESKAATQQIRALPLSVAHEACGDLGRAFQMLNEAADRRETMLPSYLAWRRDLAHDTRYRALLERTGLRLNL